MAREHRCRAGGAGPAAWRGVRRAQAHRAAVPAGEGGQTGGVGQLLEVAPGCRIDEDELKWRFAPSGGPGGQHANKAATRAEVRFDIASSASLSDTQRSRMLARLGPEARVAVDDTRSQWRNRSLAQERLLARLAGALVVERPRRPTRPTKGSVERRLQAKRRQSSRKRERRAGPDD
jgi:ribosome-associated protein